MLQLNVTLNGLRNLLPAPSFLSLLLKQKNLLLRLVMIVMGLGLMGSVAGQATVISDKPDYAPRSNAIFTGSGFGPGETVKLKVKNLSRACNTIAPDSSYLPWTVTADANGGFLTNWTVCDCAGDSLRLRAIGQTSNDTAYAYFTDAGPATLSTASISAASGTTTYGTSGTITYIITVGRSSNGSNENALLAITALPAGVTASFSPSPLNFGSGNNQTNSVQTTLTLTISASAFATLNSPFTVTINGSNSKTVAGTFTIVKAPTTTLVTVSNATYDGNAHGGTASVTGAGALNQSLTITYVGTGSTTYGPVTTAPTNAGTYSATATYAATANYLTSTDTKSFTIAKADPTVVVTPYNVTYDGQPHTASYTINGVNSESGATVGTINVSATTHTNAGTYTNEAWSFTGASNYNDANGTVNNIINKRPVTVTPNANQFKYCGQNDPTFGYTASETLISGNSYSGALGRSGTNDVGSYAYTIGTLSAGNNYILSLGGSNTFEIRGITIDASASSTPVPLGNAAVLKATVSPAASGIPVVFKLDNGNLGITSYNATTDANGYATVNASGLQVELYLVTATAGSGCASSTAYLPVYDPNGGFVTGGGWINSPAGAYAANTTLTGKANFGFVAKYKKGANAVDGNTEFQFQAGNFNFKSNLLDAGTLVISGAKATYRGVGTVNGSGNYGFMVTATDGDMNGGGGTDKFRIKIWDKSNGNNVVYDNQMGNLDNADATTVLGGGSIVIHDAKSKGAVRTEPIVQEFVATNFNVKVFGNPSLSSFRIKLEGTAMNEKITIKVVDMNGRMIEMKQNLYPGQVIELGSAYRQGTYFAEVTQGDQRKVVKLIKIGQD